MNDAADLHAWIRDRDHAAFTRLVERHAGLVRNACRRQLGDGDDADAAAQAVFILLSRRADRVREPARLAGWLLGVARDVCRHSHRSDARRRRHEHAAAVMAQELRGASVPGGDSDWSLVRPLLDEALAGLSGAQRDVVVGYYLESRPQAEIGRRLGISEDAVKQRLRYGLGKLRSWFARRGLTVTPLALAAGLASEAGAAEPAFTAACTGTVHHPDGRAADLADGIAGTITLRWLIATVAAVGTTIIVATAWAAWTATPTMAVAGNDPPLQPTTTPWLDLPWRTSLDSHRPDEIAALLWTAHPDRDLRLALPPALRSGPWQGIRWQPPHQARTSDLLDAIARATGTRWRLLGEEVVLFTAPMGTPEPLSAGVSEAVGDLLSGPPERAVRVLEGLALLPDAEVIDPPWLEPWLPALMADQPGLAASAARVAGLLNGDARHRLLACLPPGLPEAVPVCQQGTGGWARAAAARHRTIPLPSAQEVDAPLLLALGAGAASADWLAACQRTDASGIALRLLYRSDPTAGISAARNLLAAAPDWHARGRAREAAFAMMRPAWQVRKGARLRQAPRADAPILGAIAAGGIACGRGPADGADDWIAVRHTVPGWVAMDDLIAMDGDRWRVIRRTTVHADAHPASAHLAALPEGTICTGRTPAGWRWLQVSVLSQPAFLHPSTAERWDVAPHLVDALMRWSTRTSPVAFPRLPVRPGWPGTDAAEGMLVDVWRISQSQRQPLEVLDALGSAIAAQPRTAALAALREAAARTARFPADVEHFHEAIPHLEIATLLVKLGGPDDAIRELAWCEEMDRRLDLGGEAVFSLGMGVASPFLPASQRTALSASSMLASLVAANDRDPAAYDGLIATITAPPLGLRQAWWMLARADRPGADDHLLAAQPEGPFLRWQLFAMMLERACRVWHPGPLLTKARAMAAAEPDARIREDMVDLLNRLPRHLLARSGDPEAAHPAGF